MAHADDNSRVPKGATPDVSTDGAERSCPAPGDSQELTHAELDRLWQIVQRVNLGFRLDDVLDFIYDECQEVIPYHRIAYASIDYEQGVIEAKWARSEGMPHFPLGYSHAMSQTSLMHVAWSGRPRIINSLDAYLADHPRSKVTRLLIAEGLHSSLTCPLVVEGRPVGFLFFDHREANIYTERHCLLFTRIAQTVASSIERGRMANELAEQKETIERQVSELAEESRRNQREMEMARAVQEALLPRHLPEIPGIELALMYEPAEPIGGDLLDVVSLDHERMLVFMADAMGHGVPAALLMTVVRTAFQTFLTAADSQPQPAKMLCEVNRTIIELFEANYVTGVCALIDYPAGRLTLSLAGHPPPLLCRAGGDLVELTEGEIPLGIALGTTYADTEQSFEPGDALLFYTDGVLDATDGQRQRFGMERLRRLLADSPRGSAVDLVETLRARLREHCGPERLPDDVAVLALRFRAG